MFGNCLHYCSDKVLCRGHSSSSKGYIFLYIPVHRPFGVSPLTATGCHTPSMTVLVARVRYNLRGYLTFSRTKLAIILIVYPTMFMSITSLRPGEDPLPDYSGIQPDK